MNLHDAPLGGLRASGRRLAVHLANIDDALSWLEASATALDRLLDDVHRLDDLRDRVTLDGRGPVLGRRVQQVLDHIASVVNTRHGRRRLLGGLGERAVVRRPEGWVFVGDRRPVLRRIGPDLTIRVNLDGMAVLGFDTAADLLNTVERLAGALEQPSGDLAELWAQLDQRAADLVLARRAVRARTQRVRSARHATVPALHSTRAALGTAEQGEAADAELDATREALGRLALAEAVDVSLPSLRDFLA